MERVLRSGPRNQRPARDVLEVVQGAVARADEKVVVAYSRNPFLTQPIFFKAGFVS